MIMAFPANDRLRKEAPAAIQVDGTARVQFVQADVLPRYHRLLAEFEHRTGVPVPLNTSFDVKGDPIVCTVRDACAPSGPLARGAGRRRLPGAQARDRVGRAVPTALS